MAIIGKLIKTMQREIVQPGEIILTNSLFKQIIFDSLVLYNFHSKIGYYKI